MAVTTVRLGRVSAGVAGGKLLRSTTAAAAAVTCSLIFAVCWMNAVMTRGETPMSLR